MRRPTTLGTVLGVAMLLMAFSPTHTAHGASIAQSDGGCIISGDKVVSPARVRLGDAVQVRLTLRADCPEAEFRAADIVLAVDVSLSMLTNGKLAAAKVAARRFVANTDLELQRVAIVGFFEQAQTAIGLSSNRNDIFDAIDGLGIRSGTNMSAAIDQAQDELVANGRPDAKGVIVLITDGAPNQPPQNPDAAALRSANAAKLAGTDIYTIGLGSGAAENLLRQVASDADNYFFAPGPEELDAIYESIALVVAARALRDLELEDVLAADVDFITGSAFPDPDTAGDVLRWTTRSMPDGGLSWVFQVRPQRIGTYPVSKQAVVTFEDIGGQPGSYRFPNPPITVLDPVDQACSAREMWTVLVHSFPDQTGIGPTGSGCNLRFDSSDWWIGTSHRLPSLTYRLSDATGDTTLFEGRAVPGPGRVDQWLYIRTCVPPPYTLRLMTDGLDGYSICANGPVEREISLRDFRPRNYRNTLESFGFIR